MTSRTIDLGRSLCYLNRLPCHYRCCYHYSVRCSVPAVSTDCCLCCSKSVPLLDLFYCWICWIYYAAQPFQPIYSGLNAVSTVRFRLPFRPTCSVLLFLPTAIQTGCSTVAAATATAATVLTILPLLFRLTNCHRPFAATDISTTKISAAGCPTAY